MTIDYRRREMTSGSVWSAYLSCHNAGHDERLKAHAERIRAHLDRNPKDAAGRGRQVVEQSAQVSGG